MTWESRIPKNGGRLVYGNVRTHATWKSSSALPVKKGPGITSSRVLSCSIHGCYFVPCISNISSLIFVKRPLFVVSCCFVKDVHQHGTVLHVRDVTGWYFLINRADIPVNLQGDCDLWEMRTSIYNMWQKYSVRIITLSRYFESFIWFLVNLTRSHAIIHSLVTRNRHQSKLRNWARRFQWSRCLGTWRIKVIARGLRIDYRQEKLR